MRSSTAGKVLVFLSLAAVTAIGVTVLRDEVRDIRHRLHDLKSNLSAPAPVPAPPRPPLPSV